MSAVMVIPGSIRESARDVPMRGEYAVVVLVHVRR
jgi:hypothetical protein